MSQQDFANATELISGTLHAWKNEGSEPNINELAATGHILALRLELVPLVPQTKAREFPIPPPIESWWTDIGYQEQDYETDKPTYLVNLAITEIRYLAIMNKTSLSSIHQSIFAREWKGPQSGQPPTVKTMLLLADEVGLTLDLIPEKKSWRQRPWQTKKNFRSPLRGNWMPRPQVFIPLRKPDASGSEQISLF